MGLTAVEVKALRNADGVIFSFGDNPLMKNQHLIQPYKKNEDEFGTAERRLTIPVAGYFRNYATTGQGGVGEPKSAFASIHSARFDHAWMTVAETVKVGDSITLHWILSNNTETLKKAGLAHDYLELQIRRDSRRKPWPLTFKVDDRIAPYYSSARMATF
jgi:hypothetical protein